MEKDFDKMYYIALINKDEYEANTTNIVVVKCTSSNKCLPLQSKVFFC
jgi:hypothetical protein